MINYHNTKVVLIADICKYIDMFYNILLYVV